MDLRYPKDEEIEKSAEGPSPIGNRLANDSDITKDPKYSIFEGSWRRNEEIPSWADFQKKEKSVEQGWLDTFKPIIFRSLIILLAVLLVQQLWCPLLCRHVSEGLCDQCPVTSALPPTHLLAEESVSLVKELVDVDPNMATQLVLTRTAFVEICSTIVHSHLGETVRQELAEKLTELKGLISIGAERSSILTVSFQTTVSRMYKSIQLALDHLQQITHGQLITGSMVTKMKNSFEELMTSTVGQTNQLLEKAEHFYRILHDIDGKLGTLNDLAAKARTRTQDRLDRSEDEPSWVSLFEERNIGVESSKKNLQLLDRLQPMISSNLIEVGKLINRLTRFKAGVGDLQQTASSLKYSPSFSIEKQKSQLKQSIQDLTHFKQRLIDKQKN